MGIVAPPARRDRESFHTRVAFPTFGTYLRGMNARAARPSADTQRTRFGRWLWRVVEMARERGMTMRQIEEAGGVGKSTLYRWRDGEVLPKIGELRRFCEGMSVSTADAYAALGWSEESASNRPAPIIEDPDVRAVMHKLMDPNTPAAEKQWIRRQLRSLAAKLGDE
jgi:transcriptional regulator with XRE-family HTH domain